MIRACVFLLLLVFQTSIFSQKGDSGEEEIINQFMVFFEEDQSAYLDALEYIEKNWRNSFSIMAIEVLYLSKQPFVYQRLRDILKQKEGVDFGYDFDQWYRWLWDKEENTLSRYSDFKARVHRLIDYRFEKYFAGRYDHRIRLDEVRWGGVKQDGIPPLRNPEMVLAEEASYLEDDHVIFGIEVNGDYRAYPKRILAWHEMFVDEVGGIPVCGVYCTLCGTVILYKTQFQGTNYEMGTSGFLYRSNKLMYDKKTQSLWNTVWGEPVIGPLKDKGIQLEHLSVVTTTWGEWKRRHPSTTVLSLNTGHRRDYGEGVAYQEYFATDELMFNVPFDDNRLKNKQEILALRFPKYPREQLAISVKFLKKNPVYQDGIGKLGFVVFTDRTGANRVYETKGLKFDFFDQDNTVLDEHGKEWRLFEDRIERTDTSQRLERLPYHRAFWFGWHAAYPNTKLIR
ncbi:DUF3179 domain-containing protein [Ekhidna sp.]